MPIYEYGCPTCRKRRSIFFRSMSLVETDPACPECGKRGLTKLVSRVAIPRSEDARMEHLADSSALAGVDENDPRSMARWAKRMGSELGDEVIPEFDGLMEEMDGDGGVGGLAADDWTP
jgi:putative FmdB family regulatory protein